MASQFSEFEVTAEPQHHAAGPGHGRYLKNTPLEWLRRAGQLPGRALHVAILVKHQTDLIGGGAIRLSRSLVGSFGVDRWAERRALAALEHAGLITVERRRGRRPVVTMLSGKDANGTMDSTSTGGEPAVEDGYGGMDPGAKLRGRMSADPPRELSIDRRARGQIQPDASSCSLSRQSLREDAG